MKAQSRTCTLALCGRLLRLSCVLTDPVTLILQIPLCTAARSGRVTSGGRAAAGPRPAISTTGHSAFAVLERALLSWKTINPWIAGGLPEFGIQFAPECGDESAGREFRGQTRVNGAADLNSGTTQSPAL